VIVIWEVTDPSLMAETVRQATNCAMELESQHGQFKVVQGLGFRVWGLGCAMELESQHGQFKVIQSLGFRVWGLGYAMELESQHGQF
jgi:uncharacterized phage-like protein YoqJ